MAQTIADVMTPDPVTVPSTATVGDAAKLMRERDIGAVVVLKKDDSLCGLVTDRDVAVRAVATGLDPATTPIDTICSHEKVSTVTPDTPVDEAVKQIRGQSVRRLPVMDGQRVVGIVTIGDLAMSLDRDSALAEVSAASPNR